MLSVREREIVSMFREREMIAPDEKLRVEMQLRRAQSQRDRNTPDS
jgi:hypothetical protein